MSRHRLYGLTVESDIAFPELPPADAAARLTIRHGRAAAVAGAWFDIWPHSDGIHSVRAARTAVGYRIQHGRYAVFDVARDGTIVYDAADCQAALLRHFLIDHVVPLFLSLDALVLHASSAAFPDGISAFVGPGGAGKSTLALALSRAGHPIVSDDGLLLRPDGGQFTAIAAYPGIRLWRDSAVALAAGGAAPVDGATGHKTCFREAASFRAGSGTLRRIYVVDARESAHVAFTRVAGADAAIEIVRQTYRLAMDDGQALARQLDAIVALTRRVSVWRLSFPRAFERLPAVAASIAHHIESPGAVPA